ncbi:C4-dicarboxylate ABC transporter substrate-binding protein [Virgibacillus necropolis]|uniref:C4-dicarboxylate ABC transporter substrate-binding protein n=1 Tax=Virgibacillus necropolis TaxID=163877 RepID=A0A221MIJ5_9BACI|nr:C4-dicarboxylate ABC transporter substrate-binding protein [Virgibacillus necropolis]
MEITFSHNQPLDSPEHKGAVKFKELVESKTDGQVTVKIYPSLQLGSLREQVEATQFGEINITMQPSAVVSPFVDDIKVLDLPYLLPTKTKQMYELLDSEVGDELLATLETGGFKGLGFWPGGYKLFTTNGIEIHKPEDFEGVTMRTMEAPILLAQYEEWGGSPIPVPYAELYNALQQGVVDGQENPIQTIFLNNYHEVQDTIIESHHGGMTYILMANLSWFEGLPNSVQNAIIEAEKEARNVAREELVASEDEYRQKIIDSGVNYYELTPEEIEVFREASIPMHEKYYNTEKQLELLQKINDKIDEITK